VGFERGIGCEALYWMLTSKSEEDIPTTRYRRREHLLVAMVIHVPASDLERWKDPIESIVSVY
jgi:hypothetical protein